MHIAKFFIIAVFLLTTMTNGHTQGRVDNTLQNFHDSIVSMAGDAAPSPDIISNKNPHVKPYAAILGSARWPSPTIPVCWENPSAADATAMMWVKDSIERTWSAASALKFTGWTQCAGINNGIRIRIADVGPHVKSLGRYLDGKTDGMVLNFSFVNWSPSCQQTLERCIRAVAVHEFGHAIGFTHEQNRADAPGECQKISQGTSPDVMLTPYDSNSAMNYCNKLWNNNGFLSTLDVAAVKALYPPT
ncbi:M12 family metallopeptidase [Achromobacter animicus]|uniref:M12 family metallopeptidase n=1 Tax=Achromobacter animicus TaxID=1389935 RepID=UPI00146850F5|nr:M12 family metallopeptidase [Achromobacter animicus]CAB3854467.1 hypothetical protein LMG26691_02153 [Achromobacter animicus]